MQKTVTGLIAAVSVSCAAGAAGLSLSPNDTLEMQGLSVNIYEMKFHPVFKDEKNAGIQIIQHGERIATDGEVRLNPTPEQWDAVPTFVDRKRGARPNDVVVTSGYPEVGLKYHLEVTAEGEGFRVAVHLDQPLPQNLVGKAGFNLDFLPVSYFGKTYLMGEAPGLFPRNANGPMSKDGSGDPKPLASGAKTIVLAPEDPLTRVTITSDNSPLALYDARTRAQNGWFVVRALIPAGVTQNALVWHVRPNVIKNWVRKPVVSFNQAGYTPGRSKVAVIELDPHFKGPGEAALVKLSAEGKPVPVLRGKVKPWGKWLRYNYATFDFSAVKTPGVYAISYAGATTNPFRIAADAYDGTWHASLDTYIPVQMDHVAVREEYRVWHGPAHLDDARQAAPNTEHFDGYSMGPNLDSPFKAGEHIPGLNVGGWFDAGDFDIRTQTQTTMVNDLAVGRELFGMDWDDTTVDEAARLVQIRKPDGVPDVLQQIKHGMIQLLAQYKTFGHAIPGIVEPTLQQYTHLGDAGSKTDRMIYDPAMTPLQNDGVHSGVPDDRWAFTTHTTGLNYQMVSAFAAASRVLKQNDPAMAEEALTAAKALWAEEQKSAPVRFGTFNTTGGPPEIEEALAAVEMVLATKGDAVYTARLKALLPTFTKYFGFIGWQAARAVPYMDADYRAQLAEALKAAKPMLAKELNKTPFGVPVGLGTWAGSGQVAQFGFAAYVLHKTFPELIGPEYTLAAFDYMLGRHPANNLSMVSTVGTQSKLIAYGNNRADYTFIPGGMVPGVLIIKPDYPEMTTKWPFFWYENEYVVDTAAAFILAANAAEAVTKE